MFSTKERINFFDCDPAGIMFYANVYRFTHIAYEKFLATLDGDINYFDNDEYVIPIIKSEAKYRKPLKAGAAATINVTVTNLRGSSFELSYNLLDEEGDLCIEVKTVHVLVAKAGFAKTEMPEALRTLLKSHQE